MKSIVRIVKKILIVKLKVIVPKANLIVQKNFKILVMKNNKIQKNLIKNNSNKLFLNT